MFLKNLILRGFKTFADKTVIEFGSSENSFGITGIVGPNGCGKSNILDAIRFVLGEQNLRNLRSPALEQLIFAGSLNRKPVSMAEITITFDNSAHVLPLDFNEIALKRRIFREGQSDFLINREPCRLKDMQDLLLDTGLGEDSYAIINQGQVDKILSSKPEERLAVFEEAAGIAKYKNRKDAAEKKLIGAEQNILRIHDLKIEVGEQVISLEEQAKKASEYKELQTNLKSLELFLAKKRLELMDPKKQELGAQIESLRKILDETVQKEEQDEEIRNRIRNRIREIENEILDTETKLAAIKEKIDNTKNSLIIERERKLSEEKNYLNSLESEKRYLLQEIEKEQKWLEDSKIEEATLSKTLTEVSSAIKDEEIALSGLKEAFRETTLADSIKIPNLAGLAEDIFSQAVKITGIAQELLISLGGKVLSEKDIYEKRVALETSKVKFEMQQKETEKLNSRILEINLNLNNRKRMVEELEARITAQKQKISAQQIIADQPLESQDLVLLLAEKEQMVNKLECFRKEKDSASNELEALDLGLRTVGRSDRGQRDELTRAEIELAKIDAERQSLLERLKEEHGITEEEILSFDEKIVGSRKTLEEYKLRMRALEPVNLLAIEEFEKAKERHTFIEGQYNDLVAARENLKTLILELETKAQETFAQKINEISNNFSQVFSTLFEGGEGKISLNEEGVDVQVRPRGKKWLSLTLLSGGEKSLTAIAILFSLLKTKPSPFCFLDEVDAALDDANIYRFTKLLKDFATQTQIIVITHNKRTMSIADTIYGITMEEPGVSKIVSMKLTQVA